MVFKIIKKKTSQIKPQKSQKDCHNFVGITKKNQDNNESPRKLSSIESIKSTSSNFFKKMANKHHGTSACEKDQLIKKLKNLSSQDHERRINHKVSTDTKLDMFNLPLNKETIYQEKRAPKIKQKSAEKITHEMSQQDLSTEEDYFIETKNYKKREFKISNIGALTNTDKIKSCITVTQKKISSLVTSLERSNIIIDNHKKNPLKSESENLNNISTQISSNSSNAHLPLTEK